jgi:CRP-like cAMP-binding protein
VIINKGAPATHLFIVVSGRVKVSASSEDGKEITFAILGPGEVVGELALLAGSEHSATVTALEPTELLVFERRDFLALLQGQPDFAVDLLTTVCTRLRCSTEMTEDLSFLPLPVRLAKKLVTLARAYGTSTSRGMRIGLHLCQQELANLVSTTRESVNKQLALWQAEGLVATEKGFLVIRDLPTFVSRFRL